MTSTRTRRLALFLVVFSALLLVGAPARAQGAEPPAEAPPEPTPAPSAISMGALASEIEALERRIAAARELARPDADFEDLRAQVRIFIDEFGEQAHSVETAVQAGATLQELAEIDQTWDAEARQLERWSSALDERVQELEAARSELLAEAERWRVTLERARAEGASEEVLEAARSAIAQSGDAQVVVTDRLGQLFSLQRSLADATRAVEEARADLTLAVASAQQDLFVRERPPLWSAGFEAGRASLAEAFSEASRQAFASLVGYFGAGVAPGARLAGFLLAGLAGVFALRSRARQWAKDEARAESARLVLTRPVSMGLLIGLLAGGFFGADAPPVVQQLLGLLFLIPALRVLSALVHESSSSALAVLAVFYVMDRLRAIVAPFETVERLLLLAQVSAALAVVLWMVWPRARAMESVRRVGDATLMWWSTRIGIGLLVLSGVANVVGAVDLARLVANGTFSAAYLGVAIVGIHHLLVALWVLLLRSEFGRRSRMARFHPLRVTRFGSRVLGWGGLLLWLHLVLGFFAVRGPIYAAATGMLAADVSFGGLSLSLGDVLAFVAALWVALFVSRTLRFFLDQEVFPRVELQRGIPNALSTLLHYALILLGGYVALAVAGVDLGRLALVVGALSVGIGFGLQNVVNNFVSGLILLFERPVQVGDSVEIETSWGEVRRIGIRSSTIRTWDGAELIVPNADLISKSVTNWTLSDRRRRMILPVGVAYGTNPDRVCELLREVASASEHIISHPEPLALFTGFGDSSLDFELRAWIANADSWLVAQSEVNLAIHRALAEAGIEIPFPQRDVHLRTAVAKSDRDAGADGEPDGEA